MFRNTVFALLFCSVCGYKPIVLGYINGTSIISKYIYGGPSALNNTHPYMAALSVNYGMSNEYLCGGSILTNKTILTAAHCIEHVSIKVSLQSTLFARVGSNEWATGGNEYIISRKVIHPNYKFSTLKYDISILITATYIVFSEFVKPISLDFDYQGGGVLAKVAGWGWTEDSDDYSPVLKELTVETVSGEDCVTGMLAASRNLKKVLKSVDPAVEICTYRSIGQGTCLGDSGGPLVRESNGKQIGVVSWGEPCARGVPDVFARISAFKDWLEGVIE